jgi:hypothetical protein
MSASIITPATFDISKLSITDIKKLENSPSSIVYLNYNGGKLRIQAPQMPVPYDAGDYKDNKKFKVQLSFRDRASKAKVQAYYDMLQTIDKFVVDHATKVAGKWFRTPGASREMVNRDYTSSTRVSKDKEGNPKDYPPVQSIALKTNYNTGSFETALYDAGKRRLEGVTPVDVLRRGAEVTSVVDCGGIWVVGTKFGINWKLSQALINVPAEGTDVGCVIQDDEEVDDEEIAQAPAQTTQAEAADEDDEEEDETGELIEPVPVPQPVKPVVAAKTTKVVKKAAPKA